MMLTTRLPCLLLQGCVAPMLETSHIYTYPPVLHFAMQQNSEYLSNYNDAA